MLLFLPFTFYLLPLTLHRRFKNFPASFVNAFAMSRGGFGDFGVEFVRQTKQDFARITFFGFFAVFLANFDVKINCFTHRVFQFFDAFAVKSNNIGYSQKPPQEYIIVGGELDFCRKSFVTQCVIHLSYQMIANSHRIFNETLYFHYRLKFVII